MRGSKSADFYVDRVLNASEALLYALNHYSYPEAVAVLDWIRGRLEGDTVIKISKPLNIVNDPAFPVRLPPRRKFVYSAPIKPWTPKLPG